MSTQKQASPFGRLLTSKPFFVFLFFLGLLILFLKIFEKRLGIWISDDMWVYGSLFFFVGGIMMIPVDLIEELENKYRNKNAIPSVQPEQKDDSSNPDRS